MAKHRTKAQKLKVAAKRQETTELFANQALKPDQNHQKPVNSAIAWIDDRGSKPATSMTPTSSSQSVFSWRFNPSLIYQDLFKTGLASALVVGILLLIYYLSFSG
jgi:hypothetical protein